MTGEDIIALASREIGYHEGEGKANKYGRWFGLNNAPWCMEFVQWVYHMCGTDLPFKTASCGELLRWYRAHKSECVTAEPVPGCIVIFDFPGTPYDTDHTGIFVSKTNSKITTIDGNTSGGSESNGGWVRQRTRSLLYAHPTYIVPRELERKEKVKRYNTINEISEGAPWATETVAKLIDRKYLAGRGARDSQGRPADMDLSEDMLRIFVVNDRAGLYE